MRKYAMLLDPQDYERTTGRSFQADFDARLAACDAREKEKVESKKLPIPTALRWAVWERDNFTCKECGVRKNLSVDHIVAESKGGEATMKNFRTLCRNCNSRKGAK